MTSRPGGAARSAARTFPRHVVHEHAQDGRQGGPPRVAAKDVAHACSAAARVKDAPLPGADQRPAQLDGCPDADEDDVGGRDDHVGGVKCGRGRELQPI